MTVKQMSKKLGTTFSKLTYKHRFIQMEQKWQNAYHLKSFQCNSQNIRWLLNRQSLPCHYICITSAVKRLNLLWITWVIYPWSGWSLICKANNIPLIFWNTCCKFWHMVLPKVKRLSHKELVFSTKKINAHYAHAIQVN